MQNKGKKGDTQNATALPLMEKPIIDFITINFLQISLIFACNFLMFNILRLSAV